MGTHGQMGTDSRRSLTVDIFLKASSRAAYQPILYLYPFKTLTCMTRHLKLEICLV